MSYTPPKKNAEYIFYMGLTSRSTGQFQANPTLAAGDVLVSTDGGALGNLTTLPAVTPAASKMVKVTVSAAEMNGDNITIVFSDAAGAEWDDCIINIQTSVRQIDDLSTYAGGAVASVTGNVGGNVVGSVGFVTGNVGGNVVGSVGSVTGNVGGNVAGSVGSVVGGIGGDLAGTVGFLGAGAQINVRGAVGLSFANLDTQLSDLSGRLPAALSGDGFIKADLKSIDDETTDGNNATLKLKKLSISGDTLPVEIISTNSNNEAVYIQGGTDAYGITSSGFGGLLLFGFSGPSLSTPQGIKGSDSIDLNVTNISSFVWSSATRTLTSFGTLVADIWAAVVDSSGVTTLLSRLSAGRATNLDNLDAASSAIKAKTDQLTFTNPGEVDANIQSVNDTAITGTGAAGVDPWRAA